MGNGVTIERARSLVRNYTAYRKEHAETAEAVAQHMVATGDCVWDAVKAVVRGKGAP